jgi:uncharacterized protein
MTPHPEPLKSEVGVRELHDRLSRYVQHVKDGAEVVVTMRGRRVARLVPVDETDPWQICVPRHARIRSRRRPTALIAYFDTSALIKLIFDEPGSELAVELWDRADLLVSNQLAYPEARAALAAAARARRIDEQTHSAAISKATTFFLPRGTPRSTPPLARPAGSSPTTRRERAAEHARAPTPSARATASSAVPG